MINTYNETTLHRTLKTLYALQNDGRIEQDVDSYICDICSDQQIIEIQTGKLSALKKKLTVLLNNYRITIVFPIAVRTIIETVDKTGTLISRRKSPKKKNLFYLYRELTALYPLLSHEHLRLEVLLIEQTEVREKTEMPIQLLNKSRRWKKNWYKKDKRLEHIIETIVFANPQDYLAPLLTLPIENTTHFSAAELAKTIAANQAGLMLWVLRKMNLIFDAGKDGNKKLYCLEVLANANTL